jgi:hypothetical protein
MIAFFSKCLETASRECRTVTVPEDRRDLPAGHYVFHEFYCGDLNCDCRRIIVRIHHSHDTHLTRPLATISYGWESPAFYEKWSMSGDPAIGRELASVTLDPISPQSQHAEALRDLFEWALKDDPDLARRFNQHYLQMRETIRLENLKRARGTRHKRRRLG